MRIKTGVYNEVARRTWNGYAFVFQVGFNSLLLCCRGFFWLITIPISPHTNLCDNLKAYWNSCRSEVARSEWVDHLNLHLNRSGDVAGEWVFVAGLKHSVTRHHYYPSNTIPNPLIFLLFLLLLLLFYYIFSHEGRQFKGLKQINKPTLFSVKETQTEKFKSKSRTVSEVLWHFPIETI